MRSLPCDFVPNGTTAPPRPSLAHLTTVRSPLAATLPPGPYTALLAGLNNGVGIGLVEVYDRGTQ